MRLVMEDDRFVVKEPKCSARAAHRSIQAWRSSHSQALNPGATPAQRVRPPRLSSRSASMTHDPKLDMPAIRVSRPKAAVPDTPTFVPFRGHRIPERATALSCRCRRRRTRSAIVSH
jgi:hypothetical protein